MNFQDTVLMCADIPEFIESFNRLTKSDFMKPATGINLMIDNACGIKSEFKDLHKFMSFVFEFVWLPLIQDKGRQG